MKTHHDLEHEPIPGLPEELPDGESIVWQGRPDWKALARHAFKVRWVAGYFAAMLAIRLSIVVIDEQGAAGLGEAGIMTALFAATLGVLFLLAWLYARATVYTITSRRVVMRIGVALSAAWNLPFKRLASADFVERPAGDGDIVLQLAAPNRIRWIYFWPHVQPGHVLRPRPALRAIRDPKKVAAILRDAVEQWGGEVAAPVVIEDAPPVEQAAARPAVASVGHEAVV